jgi:hypothetical protein
MNEGVQSRGEEVRYLEVLRRPKPFLTTVEICIVIFQSIFFGPSQKYFLKRNSFVFHRSPFNSFKAKPQRIINYYFEVLSLITQCCYERIMKYSLASYTLQKWPK